MPASEIDDWQEFFKIREEEREKERKRNKGK